MFTSPTVCQPSLTSALSNTTSVASTGGGAMVSIGGALRPEVSREVYFSFLQPAIIKPATRMEHTIVILMNFISFYFRLNYLGISTCIISEKLELLKLS